MSWVDVLSCADFWFTFLFRNVPLGIVTEKDGQRYVDNAPILSERTTHIELDISKPFKLNADTTGVCTFSCTFIYPSLR